MHPAIPAILALVLAASLLPAVAARETGRDGTSARCELMPGRVHALVRVQRDTTLPYRSASLERLLRSLGPSARLDTTRAAPGSPMPAAHVRLLKLDDSTRAELVQAGITDSQPAAIIRAEPHSSMCEVLRWTDPRPWVRAGDVNYIRARLAPREYWVGGVPVFVVVYLRDYPYPRRAGLAYSRASADTRLTSAEAMYRLYDTLRVSQGLFGEVVSPDSAIRARAIAWARTNIAEAEHEPARSALAHWILSRTRWEIGQVRSRLRGTYRVTVEAGGTRGGWVFRTHDRPSYSWLAVDSTRSMRDIVASPNPAGYVLGGSTVAPSVALGHGEQKSEHVSRTPVWFHVADSPLAPGNDARAELAGEIGFPLAAAPAALWDALEPLTPKPTAAEVAFLSREGRTVQREWLAVRLPITLRIASDGTVRGERSLTVGGRQVRLRMERIDTAAVWRPWERYEVWEMLRFFRERKPGG